MSQGENVVAHSKAALHIAGLHGVVWHSAARHGTDRMARHSVAQQHSAAGRQHSAPWNPASTARRTCTRTLPSHGASSMMAGVRRWMVMLAARLRRSAIVAASVSASRPLFRMVLCGRHDEGRHDEGRGGTTRSTAHGGWCVRHRSMGCASARMSDCNTTATCLHRPAHATTNSTGRAAAM